MACDQYEGAVTNTTAIESMKSWEEQSRDLCTALEEIFGEPFSARWFVPSPLPTPYRWSPLDDPDAYDPRDPSIKKHFKKMEELLKLGVAPNPPLPDESAEKALLPRLKAEHLAKQRKTTTTKTASASEATAALVPVPSSPSASPVPPADTEPQEVTGVRQRKGVDVVHARGRGGGRKN